MTMQSIRNDRGSAFVELALVLPLLVLLLIGTAELGRIAYASIEVTNAARAAVAYGSQNLATAQDTAGQMPVVAAADASDLTAMGATLATTTSMACVCDTGSSTPSVSCSSAQTQCCPPTETSFCVSSPSYTGNLVHYVQANTTATVSTMFNYPGLPNSYTLHGFAQMRVVQD